MGTSSLLASRVLGLYRGSSSLLNHRSRLGCLERMRLAVGLVFAGGKKLRVEGERWFDH